MPPDWLPSTSGLSPDVGGEEGIGGYIRERAWACALVLLGYALLFSLVLFPLVGVVVGSFTLALLLAPILGLAGAGGMARVHGYVDTLDEARGSAPLWLRLLAPLPVFVLAFAMGFVLLGSLLGGFAALLLGSLALGAAAAAAFAWGLGLWRGVPETVRDSPLWVRLALGAVVFLLAAALGFVAFGALIPDFRLLVLAMVALGALATGLVVGLTGLWSDVPDRVRTSDPTQRLVGLILIGILGGLIAFFGILLVLEEVAFALAALLPGALLGAGLAGFLTGWADDALEAVRDWHVASRLAAFTVGVLVLTLYFALLVGPFLPNALLGYGVGILGALLLLVPASTWTHTWRDLGAVFVSAGEDRRFLATLPVLPLGIGLVFLLLVVTTSMFDLAFAVSVPAGVALFLLAGVPFGVTQDLPRLVRERDLPARIGIFAGFFLLAALYAYFAIALFVQIVEVALVAGVVFAGALLGGLIAWLDLHEGLDEEFDSYGGPAEALLLALTFVTALALTFVLVALTLGDFRVAFLVSVLAAAAVNYAVAHATGLVEGTREALAGLPWWAELLALSGVFVVAFLFGTVAFGTFLPVPALAMAVGAAFALASVVALSRDLELGEDLLETADERRRARSSLLVLAFLAGFLVGLYLSAAALQAVGVSLFGFPFFLGLLAGVATAITVARRRGWEQGVLERVQSTTDKLKAGVILATWIGAGVLTGLALQALPIEGPILGVGDPAGLPLTLTLAAGLLLWAWLPVVLFRVTRVERTPVDATAQMPAKRRTLASLGWGLLVAAATGVVMLVVVDNTVVSVGAALALGYLTALVMSSRRDKPEEG